MTSVTLTAQLLAALTHDIVWLEEHEVNGEKVLVPVLYLAQADNRLVPNRALIQGSDVTLIAGQDLNNAGTLSAANNLAASAGQDLTSSGLIEAGNRLFGRGHGRVGWPGMRMINESVMCGLAKINGLMGILFDSG